MIPDIMFSIFVNLRLRFPAIAVSPQVIISIHKTRAIISITLKPTTMKHLNSICISISCILIMSLPSCKKDSVAASTPPCATCDTLTLTTLLMEDSSWVRQDNGNYTSDITWIIERSGASVSQVYAIDITSGNIAQSVFPIVSAGYMDGAIYGSVDLTKDHADCTLTFAPSNEEHEGEIRPNASLPFKSVEIELFFVKRKK